ncbi:MAG: hypothetical protein ACP5N6_09485 [Anaerolineae bacterium]
MTAILILIPSLLAGAACGFLAHAGMSGLVDLARALRRRNFDRLRQVLEKEIHFAPDQPRQSPLPLPLLAGLALGLALAFVWHHPILSVWWLVLGGAFGWMMVSLRHVSRQALQVMEVFVSGLRGSYPVSQSVTAALESTLSHLPCDGAGSELRMMVAEVLRRYNSSLDLRESLDVLRNSGWPMMLRLCSILEQVSHADEGSVLDALETLEEQIRAARMLLDRSNTVLVLNRLTLRVLQMTNLAGIVVVSAFPVWRQFYIDRPLGLVAATAMALAGSWYFMSELRRIEAMLL